MRRLERYLEGKRLNLNVDKTKMLRFGKREGGRRFGGEREVN